MEIHVVRNLDKKPDKFLAAQRVDGAAAAATRESPATSILCNLKGDFASARFASATIQRPRFTSPLAM